MSFISGKGTLICGASISLHPIILSTTRWSRLNFMAKDIWKLPLKEVSISFHLCIGPVTNRQMTHMNRKDPAKEDFILTGSLFAVCNMGRRKVNHELITDESIRRVTFKKRKVGLLKKLSELTVLCGIPACAIIYSEYNDEPDVWPNRREAHGLLDRLHRLPRAKQTKHMLDQGDFVHQMIGKLEREIEREQRRNRSIEIGLVASRNVLKDADYSEELMVAARLLEQKIKAVTERIESESSSMAIVDYMSD